MTNKDFILVSKKISQLLRHDPEALEVSKSGWCKVYDLVMYLDEWQSMTGKALTAVIDEDLIDKIVKENNKGRFEYSEDKTEIRALQGHTNKNIEIEFEEVPVDELPMTLYHGTTSLNKKKVMYSGGLLPMKRHHVHLTPNYRTAHDNAMRWAKNNKALLWIIAINPRELRTHTKIYKSKNGVYLVDKVPSELIEFYDGN